MSLVLRYEVELVHAFLEKIAKHVIYFQAWVNGGSYYELGNADFLSWYNIKIKLNGYGKRKLSMSFNIFFFYRLLLTYCTVMLHINIGHRQTYFFKKRVFYVQFFKRFKYPSLNNPLSLPPIYVKIR